MADQNQPDPRSCMVNWPYRADAPQRFTGNFHRYHEAGGIARPHEDVRGFVAAEPGNGGDMGRFFFFCMAADQIAKEGIAGDMVELGVYKGSTAFVLAAMARKLDRRLFLLDTFEGFAAADLQGIDSDKSMGFADTSLERVRTLVGEANTYFIKGYFPGTATELPADGHYCMVHIDCDLYAPIQAALEYFYPRMTPGGFIIVHDYSSLHWNGAEKAVDEFFADKPEFVVPLTDGAGSVVVRKTRVDSALLPNRLSHGGWVSAGRGNLSFCLGDGWSDTEEWGIWGVGPAHEIMLPIPDGPPADLLLSLDIHAALLGSRVAQIADVSVAGESIETWKFAQTDNRAIRTARIPARRIAEEIAREQSRIIRIVLRPRDLATPQELDPSSPEQRPLGLALHRAMLRR